MITSVALPRIVADVADWTQLRKASWIINAYLLVYIATMPLAGRSRGRLGRAPTLPRGARRSSRSGRSCPGWRRRWTSSSPAGSSRRSAAAPSCPSRRRRRRTSSTARPGHGRSEIIGALTFLGMAAGPVRRRVRARDGPAGDAAHPRRDRPRRPPRPAHAGVALGLLRERPDRDRRARDRMGRERRLGDTASRASRGRARRGPVHRRGGLRPRRE